jgi:hypothetical protein
MKLSLLDVHVLDDAAAADASAMVLALQGVQRRYEAMQLARAAAAAPTAASASSSQPCELQLVAYAHHASQQWYSHPRVWKAIGQLPGLNRLKLVLHDVHLPPSSFVHLSSLSSLASSLHTLEVTQSGNPDEPDQVANYSALRSLSCLTRLHMPLAAARQGLDSISSCTKLSSLHLYLKDKTDVARQSVLQPTELAAIGQLAQLSQLSLRGAACEDAADWSFLSQLLHLQELDVQPSLPYSAVTPLAHLTCLSRLECGWEQQEGPGPVAARCAAVRELEVVSGVPPLCVFPGVTQLMQYRAWDPFFFSSVSERCTALQSLVLAEEFGGSIIASEGSLLGSAPAAARTAAVSSLAKLQHLNDLSIAVNDNAEVTAVSGLTHVKVLLLVVPLNSRCTVQGLAVLAAMRQLRRVFFELSGSSSDSLVDADVQLLLSALRHLPKMEFRVQEEHVAGVQEVVQRAEGVLKEQGLQLAATVDVEPIVPEDG